MAPAVLSPIIFTQNGGLVMGLEAEVKSSIDTA